MAKIGGRGCPRCGSHNTDALTRAGAQWCQVCDHKWIPCQRMCRGWKINMRDPEGPCVTGCSDCGVSNRVARTWPEAYNALARELLATGDKMEPTIDWMGSGLVVVMPPKKKARTIGSATMVVAADRAGDETPAEVAIRKRSS